MSSPHTEPGGEVIPDEITIGDLTFEYDAKSNYLGVAKYGEELVGTAEGIWPEIWASFVRAASPLAPLAVTEGEPAAQSANSADGAPDGGSEPTRDESLAGAWRLAQERAVRAGELAIHLRELADACHAFDIALDADCGGPEREQMRYAEATANKVLASADIGRSLPDSASSAAASNTREPTREWCDCAHLDMDDECIHEDPCDKGTPPRPRVGVGEEGATEASTKSVDAPGGEVCCMVFNECGNAFDSFPYTAEALRAAADKVDGTQTHYYDALAHGPLGSIIHAEPAPAPDGSLSGAPVASTPSKTPAGDVLREGVAQSLAGPANIGHAVRIAVDDAQDILDELDALVAERDEALDVLGDLAYEGRIVGYGDPASEIHDPTGVLGRVRAALAGVSPGTEAPGEAPTKTVGAPDGGAKCVCGHSSYWHSHGGSGDCEFGPCDCKKFRPGMGL